jgi:hypothetical protein
MAATVLIVTNPEPTFHHEARPQTAVQLTHPDTWADSNEEAASTVTEDLSRVGQFV